MDCRAEDFAKFLWRQVFPYSGQAILTECDNYRALIAVIAGDRARGMLKFKGRTALAAIVMLG